MSSRIIDNGWTIGSDGDIFHFEHFPKKDLPEQLNRNHVEHRIYKEQVYVVEVCVWIEAHNDSRSIHKDKHFLVGKTNALKFALDLDLDEDILGSEIMCVRPATLDEIDSWYAGLYFFEEVGVEVVSDEEIIALQNE